MYNHCKRINIMISLLRELAVCYLICTRTCLVSKQMQPTCTHINLSDHCQPCHYRPHAATGKQQCSQQCTSFCFKTTPLPPAAAGRHLLSSHNNMHAAPRQQQSKAGTASITGRSHTSIVHTHYEPSIIFLVFAGVVVMLHHISNPLLTASRQ